MKNFILLLILLVFLFYVCFDPFKVKNIDLKAREDSLRNLSIQLRNQTIYNEKKQRILDSIKHVSDSIRKAPPIKIISYKRFVDNNFNEVITITLKNISNKTITNLLIDDGRHEFGQYYNNIDNSSKDSKINLSVHIKPGNTKVWSLTNNYFSFVSNEPHLNINKVRFEDGTVYDGWGLQ